ncbi:MAG TPA: hypothetical protein VKT25_14210 [Ktedonobacteraceae bacterium]|nr:hypothetical protein [Ktedonobacteraceae bacterium]
MFGKQREPAPQQPSPEPIRRSCCCPACAMARSEWGIGTPDHWTGAKLCYGWELCQLHQGLIRALIRRSEQDASLDLEVLLFWFRFTDPRRTPEGEQTDE